MTKIRIAALAAVLALAAPASALAYDAPHRGAWTGYGIETTGSLGADDRPLYQGCPMSSAAEGNAAQQNFPVQQYGQTTGGNRC